MKYFQIPQNKSLVIKNNNVKTIGTQERFIHTFFTSFVNVFNGFESILETGLKYWIRNQCNSIGSLNLLIKGLFSIF